MSENLLPFVMHSVSILAALFPHKITDVINILVSGYTKPLWTIHAMLCDKQSGCLRTESEP